MTTSYKPQIDETADGYMETLTGFDEIAIEKHFDGLNIYTGGSEEPVKVLRALIFVQKRREGLNDPEAKQAVMGMPFGECNAYFVDEQAEPINPDTLETLSGEGPSAVE